MTAPVRVTALDERLLKVIGDKSAKALEKGLGLVTVGDLLRHYPRRYAQRADLTDLASLQVGEQVTVIADVAEATSRPMKYRKGQILEVVVTDGRGRLLLTFFGRAGHGARNDLKQGRRGMFAGKVGQFGGQRQLAHPEYVMLPAGEASPTDTDARAFAGGLIPVYPATAAMPTWKIANSLAIVLDVLPPDLDQVADPLPADVRERRALIGLREALLGVHRPASHAQARAAMNRLRYEEAFVLQAALARRRVAARALPATPRRPASDGLLAAFDARLPFELTAGQREVGQRIAEDLASEHPMHRLLQGEVGSGKTVVALRAMLGVVDAGGQAALLAPTEVLAVQHHRSIRAMLGDLAEAGMLGGSEHGTRVALLTGSQTTPSRRQNLLDAASGDAGIVVGTHALLEEHVQFRDLGLVVVDEQHRFGVEQRDALRAKGQMPPHVLVMTATPIPRTVAMTVFGDLETSTLVELPRGRSPISTHVVPADRPAWLDRAWRRVREEAQAGHQTFVVCPRIGDDEEVGEGAPDSHHDDGSKPDEADERRPPLAVLDVVELLRAHPALAGLRMEVLHGRMAPEAKDQVMRRFTDGGLDVLVATTVIEVGVDVPNATVMVVMDAHRFGVSQLHQLRGRIGRGSSPGTCLLVTDIPPESPAGERLIAVAGTQDGFELSRVDLEQRREGDVLGAAQSGGRSSLRLLRVVRDEDVIVAARQDASEVVDADPELTSHPALAASLGDLLADERAEFLERG